MRIIIEIDDVQKASHAITYAPSDVLTAVTPAAASGSGGAIDAGPAPGVAASSHREEPATSSPGAPVTYTREAESAGVAPSLANETWAQE
jgi:hypothetical protein